MTKEEMDRKIVEKKFAQLSVADCAAIMSFNLHIRSKHVVMAAQVPIAEKLLKLNLAKRITYLPDGTKLGEGFFLQLTSFGEMIRKEIETIRLNP